MKLHELATLPDDALIDVNAHAAVTSQSVPTVWRRTREEPNYPKPIRLSSRCTRWRMGAVRAFIAEREGVAA